MDISEALQSDLINKDRSGGLRYQMDMYLIPWEFTEIWNSQAKTLPSVNLSLPICSMGGLDQLLSTSTTAKTSC